MTPAISAKGLEIKPLRILDGNYPRLSLKVMSLEDWGNSYLIL
jgi:hypothetical protein